MPEASEHGAEPPSSEKLGPSVWVSGDDLRYEFIRARGPGGQAVNKVSSAARMRVTIAAIRGLDDAARERLRRLAGQRLTSRDEIVILAREHRAQSDNRRACVDRLRGLIAAALSAPKPRKKRKPTRAMIQRRLAEKQRRAEKKRQRQRWADD